jgi:hypothetical protein
MRTTRYPIRHVLPLVGMGLMLAGLFRIPGASKIIGGSATPGGSRTLGDTGTIARRGGVTCPIATPFTKNWLRVSHIGLCYWSGWRNLIQEGESTHCTRGQ